MWETVHRAILAGLDWPLGWLLRLPSDAAIILVAILTSGVLTLLRRVATDQDWLRRAAADARRLRDLAREARRRRDKDALARHGGTIALIKRRALRYEARPLLYAVVPVVLLAVWCFGRLEFHPPRAGEPVEVRVRLATSAVGRPIHLVPEGGLASEGGWVRQVAEDEAEKPDGAWAAANAWLRDLCGMTPMPGGVAVWRLAGDGSRPRYDLRFRFGGETFRKELCVGGRTYAPAVAAFDAGPVRSIELAMRPVKLFGLVGGMDWLGFPPWLVAYLVIAIPFVSVLRRLFRVA